jgi:asparagine synthase (glutamine-hydrolysing)
MCGIAGFTGAGAALVPALLERLAHRGPDGHGSFTSECGSVTLCHTRLAIIDPSERGAQPMRSADGRVVIVFNGEIYNFRELARDLEKRNVRFRSHSDTEVLLALYDAHGVEMLRYLNGIYALALWDARDGTLFVARDSLGVKPLYICESAGRFAFASEIKALTVLPWVERTLDPQALAHYVQHLWCPTPRTPLASVKKLGPGEALVVSGGRVRRRWAHYALPTPTVGATAGRKATGSKPCATVWRAAVERQMVSDVPVGAFLSGGLDSSAIVAFARQHNASRLQCFTIDFDAAAARREGFSSDLPYARSVASHLDVDLHVVTSTPTWRSTSRGWSGNSTSRRPTSLGLTSASSRAWRDSMGSRCFSPARVATTCSPATAAIARLPPIGSGAASRRQCAARSGARAVCCRRSRLRCVA